MENRILKLAEKIETKLEMVSIDKKNAMRESLNLASRDYADYQDMQSKAFASGLINFEEAQTIYVSLQSWETVSVSLRYAITKAIEEIASKRISAVTGSA